MATLYCVARTRVGHVCTNRSKILDGQRRFCGIHHPMAVRHDEVYRRLVNAFKADPAVVAAKAAMAAARTAAERLAAENAYKAAEDAMRERQQPGILAAEHALAPAAPAPPAPAPPAPAPAAPAPAVAAMEAQLALAQAQRDALERVLVAMRLLRDMRVARDRALPAERAGMGAAIALQQRRFEDNYDAWMAIDPAARQRAAANQAALAVAVPNDPVGDVDLRAMAADTQSTHRRGVLSTTEAAIFRICERPIAADQATMAEALAVIARKRPSPGSVKRMRDELERDYNMVTCFGFTYAKVLDHVWGILRAHEHRATLENRFIQEMLEGRGMCNTGKMTRLINVLAGFDDAVGDLMPPAEVFRNRIALVSKQPMAERESAARALFHEFRIPAEEQDAWLEPLLDA